MGRERTAEFVLRGCGAVLGAMAGALTGGLLAFTIFLFGLLGSGHGDGPLAGTELEPVASSSAFCPFLGVLAGAVAGESLVRRRLAKRVDRQCTYPEPAAESGTDAPTGPERLRMAEPLEGDNDG